MFRRFANDGKMSAEDAEERSRSEIVDVDVSLPGGSAMISSMLRSLADNGTTSAEGPA